MPELPETETLARDLHRSLVGSTVAVVRVLREDVLRGSSARQFASRIRNARIERVWRRAKSVVLDLSSGDRLVVTPRFTGGLLVAGETAADDPFTAIRFDLTDGRRFTYRDVRRLGTVALLGPAAFPRFDARLGVEPLDSAFTPSRLSDFLRGSRQAVKKLLMDQRRIAGVGNIYANEALWLAGIDPSRPGRGLSEVETAALHGALVKVLSDAVEARGTTFRDFRDAQGERGGYASRLAVYGRAGAPCPRCGTRLSETHAIDGRTTVFCHRCQV